jgi:ABC-type branched-subunit amino acid transport system ATPase component
LLQAANNEGKTILLVAHGLGAMSGLASRAVVLDRGRLIFDGPADEVPPQEDLHHHDPGEEPRLRPIGGER